MRLDARNRRLAVLAAALVVLWAALRPELPTADESPLLLPSVDAGRARRVLLEDPGGPTAVELVRGEEGWEVVGRFGLAAYGYAVDALLSGLASVRRADLVSDQDSSWPVYGVGEGALHVLVTGAGGTVLADVLQGGELRPGDTDGAARLGTFVRPSHEVAVYRAPHLAPLRAEPDAWLDTRLAPGEPPQALALVEDELGELELERVDGGWRAADGRPAPAALVEELLERLATAHFLEPVAPRAAPEHGFDDAGAWEVVLRGATDLRLRFAPATPEGQLVERPGGTVVRVSARTAELVGDAERALARALGEERP